jgi:6-pyruvoyltetrahydropterin/6-carboxytetrahydropterin synthase
VPSWSEERNLEVFGKCANPHFHGHNYDLEVKVTGDVDPETGILINLKDLKEIIREHIEDKLDHRNLNVEIPEFQELIPTVENICFVIWRILRMHLDVRYELKVRLYETPRNFVEYPAD